jgi:hypothetical protein
LPIARQIKAALIIRFSLLIAENPATNPLKAISGIFAESGIANPATAL